MSMKKIWIASLALACLGVLGCKKEKVDLLDPVPQILSLSLNSTVATEYQDSIIIRVEYRDGDGDLGENSPDATNLFVLDQRINAVESFRIRELAPEGAEIPITGILRVAMGPTGITNGSSSEQFKYTIWLKDRAGNESERVETTALTLNR